MQDVRRWLEHIGEVDGVTQDADLLPLAKPDPSASIRRRIDLHGIFVRPTDEHRPLRDRRRPQLGAELRLGRAAKEPGRDSAVRTGRHPNRPTQPQ